MGAAEVRKMAHGVDVQIESVDDTVQRIFNIQEGVSDGTQVIRPIIYARLSVLCSGAEKTSRPLASDFGELTRS